MDAFLIVGRIIAYVAVQDLFAIFCFRKIQFRTSCLEMDNTPQCITTIKQGSGSEQNIHLIKHRRIYRDRIMQVTIPVYGIVHTNAINDQKEFVGFKSSNNRATSTHLASLHIGCAIGFNSVRCILSSTSVYCFGLDSANTVDNIFFSASCSPGNDDLFQNFIIRIHSYRVSCIDQFLFCKLKILIG